MKYSKIKKIISALLIFFLLFSLSFRVPFSFLLNKKAVAAEKPFFNLVSIIVEEDIYNRIRANLNRYARDIQGVLENTKVAILPAPEDVTSFQIASLNEALYFKGYKEIDDSVDFDSKLIGTILVGKLPIPIVFNKKQSSKTIIPYVDFEDKIYVYNNTTQKYEKNIQLQDDFKAEIWHGIINPNSSNGNDVTLINGYFDKNHDFYTGEGLFKTSSGIINGLSQTEDLLYYEPHIFYYDQYREEKTLNINAYKGYVSYQDNLEDIDYYKYDKNLANNIQESTFGDEQEDIRELAIDVQNETGINFDGDLSGSDNNLIDTDNAPSVQTRHVTEKSANTYLETINNASIGETKKLIYNAGRYNKRGSEVNIDLVPYLISVQDQMSSQTIKSVNNAVEDRTDNGIKSGLSTYIALPTKIDLSTPAGNSNGESGGCPTTYTNFKHGKEGELIKNASECTIYKGNTNGILVEANRGYNLGNIEKDLSTTSDTDTPENIGQTTGFWGGCSPLNLDLNEASNGNLVLNECILDDAIKPLFDIQGSKIITDSSKNPDPRFCFINNYILTSTQDLVENTTYGEDGGETTYSCEGGFSAPTSEQGGEDWDGASVVEHLDFQRQFEDVYQFPTLEPENGLIYPFGGGCEGLCYYEDEGDDDDDDDGGDGDADNEDDEGGGGDGAYIDIKENKKIAKLVPCNQIKKKSFLNSLLYKASATYLVNPSGDGSEDGEEEECDGFLGQGIEGAAGGNTPGCCVYRRTFLDGEQVQEYESGGATSCINVAIGGVEGKYMGNAWYQNMSQTPLYPVFNFTGLGVSNGGNTLTAQCWVVEENIDGEEEYILHDYEWNIPSFDDASYRVNNADGASARRDPAGDILVIFLPAEFRVPNECEYENYYYKRVTSWVEHESPTNQEVGAEIQGISTPDLPIDKDRYIDFIGVNKTYFNVPYVKAFRENTTSEKEFDKETITDNLTDEIEPTQEAYNGAIEVSAGILEELGGQLLQIYVLLSTGSLPEEELDIKSIFDDEEHGGEMPNQTYDVEGNTKEIHYWDVFTQNLYWKNIESISEKYRYIFENYLGDQFGMDYKFVLPKNKKIYEIAYIGAPGDSNNMYIKIDQGNKEENPYSSEISENIKLDTFLSSEANTSSTATNSTTTRTVANSIQNNSGNFTCGSSDGVSIFNWLSSVDCWTSSLNPPKINYSNRSNSSSNTTSYNNKIKKGKLVTAINNVYLQGNSGLSLDFSSDYFKYYINDKGILTANVNGLDNTKTSYIKFELARLDLVGTGTTSHIYNINNHLYSSEENLKEALKYINFSNSTIRIQNSKASSYFSTKIYNINASFKATILSKDSEGNIETLLESNGLEIEVRGDKLSLKSYKLNINSIDNYELGKDTLLVSDNMNLFLIDNERNKIEDVITSINASSSAKEKLIISLGSYSRDKNNNKIEYPIEIEIKKEGQPYFKETNIDSNSLENFKNILALQESGQFEIIIIDSKGYKIKKDLYLEPEEVSNIDIQLTPSTIQSGQSFSEHILYFLDRFGNLTKGRLYNYNLEINGDGALFYDKYGHFVNRLSGQSLEGFKKFYLVSTNNEENDNINMTLTNINGEEILSNDVDLNILNNINIDFIPQNSDNLYVGGNSKDYILRIRDANGNVLSNFNSKAYIKINSLYGTIQNPFINIENGEGDFTLISNNLAGEDIKIEAWVEGINTPGEYYTTIFPQEPVKIEISLSKDEIEASNDAYSTLYVTLRDRYLNKVFNDNSTRIYLDILGDRTGPISNTVLPGAITNRHTSGDRTPYRTTKRVRKGETTFTIYGTDYPGRGYFKVGSTSSNSFDQAIIISGQRSFLGTELFNNVSGMIYNNELTDIGVKFFTKVSNGETGGDSIFKSKFQLKETLLSSNDYKSQISNIRLQLASFWDKTNYTEINGLLTNAGKIDTYFFWNKNSINGKRYSSLYSFLLGAPYGDVEKQDNLSSAMLFDSENRSLAVTSILSDPYAYEDVLAIEEKGVLSNMIETTNNITQDIVSEITIDSNNRLYIDIFNDALKTYVGKVYYNLLNTDLSLNACEENNIKDCIDEEKTSVVMKVLDKNYILKEENGIFIVDKYGKNVFGVNNDGEIEKTSNIYLELDKNNEQEFLSILIKDGNNIIGQMVINFIDGQINITREKSLLNLKLNTLNNSIIIYIDNKIYGTRKIGTREIIFYNDPLKTKGELNIFNKENQYGIENFMNKDGIGWGGLNKTLLAFSAGESVGEATKDYMSFSLINLGDPVVALKKIRLSLFDSANCKVIVDGEEGIFSGNTDKAKPIYSFSKSGGEYCQGGSCKATLDCERDSRTYTIRNPGEMYTKGAFIWNPTGSTNGKLEILLPSSYGNGIEGDSGTSENLKLFDPTLGRLLYNKEVESFEEFDYNNDGRKDILLIKNDGYVEILENKRVHSKFIDKGNIINLIDLGPKRLFKAGDFTGDGYDDIFFVNNESKPFLLNNIEKNFTRQSLEESFQLTGNIVQIDVFDMDNDNISDIVLLDDSGQIHIFYGGGTSTNPQFTKNTISQDFGVKLNESSSNNGWALYYDGLSQYGDSEIDNYRYINLPYTASTTDSHLNSNNIDINNDIKSEAPQTTFIFTEYSNLGLQKKYTDRNGGYLQAGDIIDLDISLTPSSRMNNIALMFNIPKNFQIDSELTVTGSTSREITVKSGKGNYNISVEGFSLNAGETLRLTQELKMLPLEYGYMQVGLYEKDMAGDDLYGDIIVKGSKENKGEDAIIFRSSGPRNYNVSDISPEISEEDVVLPSELEELSIDEDGNGMPDYIDGILTGVLDEEGNILSVEEMDTEKLEDYSMSTLNDLSVDKDCDCIPDYDDKVISFDEGAETFSPGYSCNIPFGNSSCLSVTVDGEEGRYVGDSNGNRPTFRFSSPGSSYCGGGACLVEADCDGAIITYDIANAGTRESQGEFLWKPISDSDGNLVVLLPSKYAGGISKSEATTLSVEDFDKAKTGIDASSDTALQDLASNLLDMGYDACAYEEALGYTDKINVNGKVYDVRIYFTGTGWNPIPILRDDITTEACGLVNNCSYGAAGSGEGCNTKGDACSSSLSFPTSCEDIEWVDGNNICNRSITSSLDVTMTETNIIMNQSITTDLAGDAVDGTVGNPWIIFAKDCKWYGITWERLRPYQTTKALPIGLKRIVDSCWKPIKGETYGIMVSGLARFGASNQQVRTNIEWINRGAGNTSSETPSGAGNSKGSIGQGEYMNYSNGLDNLNSKIDDVVELIDNLIDGFNCGFGGCISTPLNWAPLAPGGDPYLFGKSIGDGNKIDEGLPIFSALTWMQYGPYCGPSVWPISPLKSGCSGMSAGGRLGIEDASNYFRLFVTPTLTGAMGLAICFTGPAKEGGKLPKEGVRPITLGGNCIVLAYPFFGCEGENDGEPNSMGYPTEDISGDYSTINGNYQKDTDKNDDEKYGHSPSGPLVTIGSHDEGYMESSISVDTSAILAGDFSADAIKIENERVMAFPEFLMDWVDRQIREIVNKITDLPTIYIILPDFSGIFDDGWEGFKDSFESMIDDYNDKKEKSEEKKNIKIDDLRNQKASLDCNGSDSISCTAIDLQIETISGVSNLGISESASGIKAVYEFLGNIPLVNIKQEVVNINVPWIDSTGVERIILDRKKSISQWQEEIDTAQSNWDPSEVGDNIIVDISNLIDSVERNIEILEDYKNTPEKIRKIITIKETRLNQILENIDNAFGIILDRIPKNGKRFKAWVELYILIKSILKTWQLFIDIFNDYDTECHVCKNERDDMLGYFIKLISMVVPKIPIIVFPKWPDIIIDLHNIKAGITIYLPELEFNLRPIVLPTLPELHLPDAPDVNVNIPSLPELPTFDLPDLPDIPTLPEIDLPDIPAPPTIPDLYGAVELVLKIAKLILKIKCLLNTLPFFPEHKAGDQIAFLTERQGYLPTDFIDLSFPKFEYSFVEAIKVSTYVNLEYETDFITSMVRNVTKPLNTFTNDIVNMFDISIKDLDFRSTVPSEINVGQNTKNQDILTKFNNSVFNFSLIVSTKLKDMISYMDSHKNNLLTNREFINYISNQLSSELVTKDSKFDDILLLWQNVRNLTYSNEDKIIKKLKQNAENKYFNLKKIIKNEKIKTKKLKEKLNTLKSDKLITNINFNSNKEDLKSYNRSFDINNYNLAKSFIGLSNIKKDKGYSSEINKIGENIYNKIHVGVDNLKKQINYDNLLAIDYKTYENTDFSSFPPGFNTEQKIVDNGMESLTGSYFYNYKGIYVTQQNVNYLLFTYLDEFKGNEKNIHIDIDNDGDNDIIYIMENKVYLKENLKNKPVKTYLSTPPLYMDSDDNKFFNGSIFYPSINGLNEINISSFYINANFAKPLIDGLNNFRLEFYTIIDKFTNLDNNDYLPEGIKKFVVDAFSNIKKITVKEENTFFKISSNLAYIDYVGTVPNVVLETKKLKNIRDNLNLNNLVILTAEKKLYSGEDPFLIEYFTGSTNKIKGIDINSFTGSISQLVDSYSNIEFSENVNIIGLTGDAYISLESEVDLESINSQLDSDNVIIIEKGTTLYSPNQNVRVNYYTTNQNDIRSFILGANSIKIIETKINITGLSGEVFKSEKAIEKLNGNEISSFIGKPLLPGAKIYIDGTGSTYSPSSHIDIRYYDNSINELDFRKVSDYRLYDIWSNSNTYSIRIPIENDYYYAKIKGFKEGILGTVSKGALLAPQLEADKTAPELEYSQNIEIPLYETGTIDFTPYIYEKSGIDNIKDIYFDFDLNVDSNNDGDLENDNNNSNSNIIINNGSGSISVDFGPYEEETEKTIRIHLVDKNNNIGYKDLNFRVYSSGAVYVPY